jgi:cytochrome c oxidase subunit 2
MLLSSVTFLSLLPCNEKTFAPTVVHDLHLCSWQERAGMGLLMISTEVVASTLSAAGDIPMGYLSTYGPAADPITRLNWGLIAISVSVVLIITALVLYAALRKRRARRIDASGGFPARLPVVPDRGGMAWIYIGVGISTIVLFGSTAWTLNVLSAVAAPTAPMLTIDIVAHQWWWEARYRDADGANTVVTANEIHIPAGEPVRFRLISHGVIHSFWVPKLSGKTDVIPGMINYNWVQADKPGVYMGRCAEFCGPQHAHMAFYVIAETPASFEAWKREQALSSTLPANASPQVVAGKKIFLARCATCHTVRGTPAEGTVGPDLTHLMSRSVIAGGILPNTRGSLHGWIADPQSIKPGVRMPGFQLEPEELHALVDYLETLK